MTQFYPYLFSFYVLGSSEGRLKRKQPPTRKHTGQPTQKKVPPATILLQPVDSRQKMERPAFAAQQQFLDLIEQLKLLTPGQKTLKNILAYAAGKMESGADKQVEKDNYYDPKAALSICN